MLDRSLEHTASLINAFVDLLDEDDKKQDVLTSWKGFEVEVNPPSLSNFFVSDVLFSNDNNSRILYRLLWAPDMLELLLDVY